MIKKINVMPSYCQFSFLSIDRDSEDPEWTTGEEKFVYSKNGIYISCEDNERKTVIIADNPNKVNIKDYKFIVEIDIESNSGIYELASPDYVLNGDKVELKSQINLKIYVDINEGNYIFFIDKA